jgi:hypothetical protein
MVVYLYPVSKVRNKYWFGPDLLSFYGQSCVLRVIWFVVIWGVWRRSKSYYDIGALTVHLSVEVWEAISISP